MVVEMSHTFRCVCGWLLKPHRRTVVGTLTCNTFAGGTDVNYLWKLGIYNALILSESLNCVRWYGHLPVFFNVHVTVSNKSGEGWGAISFGILSVNLNTSYGNVKRKLIYFCLLVRPKDKKWSVRPKNPGWTFYRDLLGDILEWCFWCNWANPRVSPEFRTEFLFSRYAITQKKNRGNCVLRHKKGLITPLRQPITPPLGLPSRENCFPLFVSSLIIPIVI